MLLETCERLLNERVAATTATRERLRALAGRRMAVEVAGTDSGFVLSAHPDRLELARGPADASVDVTLRAGPLGLLLLARSSSIKGLRRSGAVLEGRPHVAEEFAALLALARPELEAELAGFIGGMAAHEVGRAVRQAQAFARRAARALERDAADYLREENPTLARPLEIREFAADVDRLRDDVERAAARLAALAGALAGRA